MRRSGLSLISASLLAGLGCGLIGKAASDSDVCKAYFAKAEECAAKVGGVKGDTIRATAAKTRENLEKNGNPLAVTKTCEVMLQTLNQDPECAKAGEAKAEPK